MQKQLFLYNFANKSTSHEKKYIICLFTVLLAGLCACSDDEPVTAPVSYDIPAHVVPDIDKNSVVMISSNKQFRDAFGVNSSKLEDVNFKKSHLAVVTGVSNYGIAKFSQLMTADGNSQWKLDIKIEQNLTTEMRPWTVAYLVPCGTKASDIRLSIETEPAR